MRRQVGAACFVGLCAAAIHGEELTGDVEIGWREVDVSGDRNKYREDLNLDDGPRLLGLKFSFEPDEGDDRLPDRIEGSVSNLGGDPYEHLHFSVREHGSYRFNFDRSRSSYFYEDILILPVDASIEGSTGGDFHHFDFERVRDDLDLTVQLSERATATVGFERYRKEGNSTTTLDVQRDEFELDRPIDETREAVQLALQYRWDKVTVVFEESMDDFESLSSTFLPGFSIGENPADPTTLDFFFLDQPYDTSSRHHRLSVRSRPIDELDIRFSASRGDLELDAMAAERAQGIDFTDTPFTTDATGSGDIDRDIDIVVLEASYTLTDRINLIGELRRQKLDQTGSFDFDGNGANSSWDIETDEFELGAEFMINPDLLMTVGWSTEERKQRTVEADVDLTVSAAPQTERDGYFLSLDFNPMRELSITASIESDSFDDPFTLASPTDSMRYRVRGRYRWSAGYALTASYRLIDRDNDNTSWESRSQHTVVRLSRSGDDVWFSLGATLVNIDHEIEQLVTGGSRQDPFSIDYASDAQFVDAALRWTLTDDMRVGGSARFYDNDGTFNVERVDVAAFVEYALNPRYDLRLSYRNVDYEEPIENYDVDIVELSVKLHW